MTECHVFLTGPAFIVSLSIFCIGMAVRFVRYFMGLDQSLDRVAYRPCLGAGMRGGLHSICKWLLPFGTRGWRSRIFFTFCFFFLHFGAVLIPLFLTAHVLFLHKYFGIAWPTLPQAPADALAILTLGGGILIIARRIVLPEVRLISGAREYFVPALALAPFLTGLLVRMHVDGYETWLLLHIAVGELLLILAPFTRLSHIVLYFASRWQIGADFAVKRGGHRRGPRFPW